jgi:DNA invertase Pin-like site-specific DNA recombinase
VSNSSNVSQVSRSDLITPQHLCRLALVYIRQSSPQQVLTNQESLRLQYALQQHAQDLGWPPERIEVIDTDLGVTAATAAARAGFQDVVAKVTHGDVGIILSVEVTRLARNCSDWYPLLDLCGFTGCLIADRDGVYDPASVNGRLVLGLKGQISELELFTLKARLTAGLLQKAQRGELSLQLPVGLMRDERGVVQKVPNREVQQRLMLVFTTFLEVRSASKVAAVLNAQGLALPRRDRFGDVVWRRPTCSAVVGILRNPAYAGAFVYGRHEAVRRDPTRRRPVQRLRPIAAWRIHIPDKYPAYIDWALYARIQTMLDDNRSEYTRDRTRGVPREGRALLQGMVYCGESGHKLNVIYRPHPHYCCVELRHRYGGSACQHIPADPVDARVVAAFFAALAPAELDLYDRAMSEQRTATERLLRAQAQQVERLRYEAALAERRFQRVDPDNRLVAAELEQRWEQALRVLKEAEEMARRQELQQKRESFPLDPSLRAALGDLGQRLPAIWDTGVLSQAQKKALLRCLIDKVVIHRPVPDRIHTRIVWRGGDTTSFDIPIAVGSLQRLSCAGELTEHTRALHAAGLSDVQIAQRLTALGYRSPRREHVLESTVRRIRLQQRIFLERPQSHPGRPEGYLAVSQVAERLGVTQQWLYYRIYAGQIDLPRDEATNLYLFPDHPDTIPQLQQLKMGTCKIVHLHKGHHHE